MLLQQFDVSTSSLFLRVCLWAVLTSGFASQTALAEVPGVTALFPAGVQAGQSARVKLQGPVGTAPVEVLVDRPDVSVAASDKPDEYVMTATAEARPGVAWLRWHNAEGASDLLPFVIGTMPEILEVEPNNAAKEAQAIASLPVTINGALEKRHEIDTFAIPLKAGQTLIASLDANRTLPSPVDASLQIADSKGFVVGQNDDSFWSDPQIVFTAPVDGTWFLRIFGFPAEPNASIEYTGSPNSIYRLHLTTGLAVDYVLPLVRQPGEFAAGGWNLNGEKVSLVGEPGKLQMAPLAGGVVPFAAFTVDQLPEPVGAVIVEEPASASQVISIFSSTSGVVETPGDIDTYSIPATKGQTVRIQTHSRSVGSWLDPLVRLRNANGELITEQDDKGSAADPSFDFSFPSDGEYILEVTDRFGHGSDRHFYSVVIGPEVPDFELSVVANRFTLDRTKPLEIPVTINRLVGLNVPIQFTVEGLPAGVTLEPVESKPEGETAKAVTLKLSVAADAPAAKGPIRIVGQTTGPDLKHAAKGPINGVKVTTENLWITLPVKP